MSRTGSGLDVFYPIVPDWKWVARLAPLGVRSIQLRLKGAEPDEIRRQIGKSLAIAACHGCQLVVNDYWREALDLGVDFIHLGQEDLETADIGAIKGAGLKLGISTHDEDELAIALAARPDYIALGPVYETTLKVMRWAPQGLDRIGLWRRRIGGLPLVAIGGLTLERAPATLAAGATSIAVVTDIVAHRDPDARARAWLAWAAAARTGESSS